MLRKSQINLCALVAQDTIPRKLMEQLNLLMKLQPQPPNAKTNGQLSLMPTLHHQLNMQWMQPIKKSEKAGQTSLIILTLPTAVLRHAS